jgi:hypothetical protein
MVIAHHIVLTGYGHWLPNDPRGSMSQEVHNPSIRDLGPAHFGRKEVQPAKADLREFYREAKKRLAHPTLWWDDIQRQTLADSLGRLATKEKLTAWACAVLGNHAHLLIRRHRLQADQMVGLFKEAGREALKKLRLIPESHPLFSADSLHVFKSAPAQVQSCIRYINDNYTKHKLIPTQCSWVVAYDNWPFHKQR